jgi:hypothetical protein
METAYLFACGLGATIWAMCFWLRRDLRTVMIGMSIAGIPLALSDIFYVPTYWRPRTLGHVPIGIEGAIFSFEAAGICAAIYAVAFGRRIIQIDGGRPFDPRHLGSLRLAIPFLPLPISAAIAAGLHTDLEWGLYAGLIVATATTIAVRPDLLAPSLLGGLAFLPVYASALLIWIAAYPSVHGWFRLWRMPHWYIFGVPQTEIVFGALFAAFWTTVYPMVFEARFVKSVPGDARPDDVLTTAELLSDHRAGYR